MDLALKKRIIVLALLAISILFLACGKEKESESDSSVITPPDSSAHSEILDKDIPVRITEIMASNKTVLQTENGLFPDWIELTNTGDKEINLSGCGLSDDANKPLKWIFPDRKLEPGERILIFFSNSDLFGEDEMNTGFSLSRKGETVFFSQPSGKLIQSVSYSALSKDMSLCIDEAQSYTTYEATPGYPNTEEGRDEFIESADRHGALTINEAAVFNDSFWFIHGEYYDWVELKNTSEDTILLSDYYLTDSSSEPFKSRLPDIKLAPGELFVLLCVGEDDLSSYSAETACISFNASGDTLYIYSSDGKISDRAGLYCIPLRGSIGRMDGESGFFFFMNPSPSKNNTDGYRRRTLKPEASIEAGIYNDVDSLKVELSGEGTIYYTLDGSEPDISSSVYTGPIEMSATSVLRACACTEGKMVSETATFDYVINENHTIPVVCVDCRQKSFNHMLLCWGDHDLYCDANVSYYGEDGSFSRNCAFKLHGSSAREALTKKHFKLVFSDRYGGDLKYDMFGDGKYTEFHSLLLRGDFDPIHLYRDALAARVTNKVSVTDAYALNSKFCILYINGQYWGIYDIREAYSQKYAADHSGDEEENIIIKRAPVYEFEDPDSLTYLFQYIASKNMNNPEYYAYASERFDMESLAQWLCLESFFNNADPTGNIRYFKSTLEGSKWKMMFFDLDQSMSNDYISWDIMTNISCQIGGVCYSLVKSDMFKQQLLTTASQLLDNGLNSDTVLSVFDEMIDEVDEEMPRNLKRWNFKEEYHESLIEWQKSKFTRERTEKWLQGLKDILRVDTDTMHEYFPDYY